MKTIKITLSVLISIILINTVKAQNSADSISHYRNMAREAAKAKDFESYQSNIEKIVQLNSDDYMSRFMLARAYVINDSKEKAIEQLAF
ncbi:MAG: hypothetical protein HC831_23555 [Chloroflexia bacterium]|nr:hypothetical protein [Chloroflexia bacterium]